MKKSLCLVVGGNKGIGKEIFNMFSKKNTNTYVLDLESRKSNKFIQVDLDREKIPVRFDDYKYILLLDVIEHLKEPEKFLRNLYNQMSTFPNQKLIISTPNVANIVIRLMLLFGNFNYDVKNTVLSEDARDYYLVDKLRSVNEFKK